MTLTARQLRQPPTIEAIERVPYFANIVGEGQVPPKNYYLDLYNKLTVQLQEKIIVALNNLLTY